MTREEAIEVIQAIVERYSRAEKYLYDGETEGADIILDDEDLEALDMAISALKGGWIPIEEGEPDNIHERVYVTQLVPRSPCKPNGTMVYITRFIDLHEKKKYITAWQPLPEPYKAESEE